jgi:GDPmannose 4,6-dehydratase
LEKLVVGDLSAEIDWGYAPDYVDAMIRILALDAPDDFVIATGRLHSVREFVEIVFQRLGLDWKAHVDEDPSILVGRHPRLVGDSAKLRRATGWAPSTDLAGMIDHLLKGRGAQL